MAQEIAGTHVRLLQSDAHIIRYPEEKIERQGYGFHAGWHPESGSTTNGLYHCPFIKTLTNLTDLGPDDGGTTVIAGSHKLAGIEACRWVRQAPGVAVARQSRRDRH